MQFWKRRGIISLVLAGCLVFTAEFEVLAADSKPEAQAITVTYETEMSPLTSTWEQLPAMASMAVNTQEWQGKALANTDSQLNVYAEMSESSKIVGRMYSNTAVTVVETTGEWTKISSGSVEGYVKSAVLLTGTAAVERAAVTCVNGTGTARKVETITSSYAVPNVDTETLLAALIYCEAGNQPYEGKVAVGAVVMNRVASGRFPNTITEVIYQRGQFTPAMTGKLARVIASGNIPSSCYDAARAALSGQTTVGNALFFNTSHGSFKLGDHYFT